MKVKLLVFLMVVAFLGFSLSGCGCFVESTKVETPVAKQVTPTPPPPPPPPVAKQVTPPPPPPSPKAMVMTFEAAALFDFDKAVLKPQGKERIKEEIKEVKADMSRADKIKVTGHTDSTGTADYNKKLSLRRAETVRDYLVSLGVDGSKLEVIGAGEANPIADNSTKEGQAKNRRVEVEVIGLEK